MPDLLTAGVVGLGVGLGLVVGVAVVRVVRRWIDTDDTPKM